MLPEEAPPKRCQRKVLELLLRATLIPQLEDLIRNSKRPVTII